MFTSNKKPRYNRFTTYASIDFSDYESLEEIVNVLSDIEKNKMKITYPFSICYGGKNFKIKERNELIVFIASVQSTFDLMLSKVKQECNEIESVQTVDFRYCSKSYEPNQIKYGIVESDVLYYS